MRVVSRHFTRRGAYKSRGEHVLWLHVHQGLGFDFTRATVRIERRGLTWAVVER